MYTTVNYKTKKELREAVAAWNKQQAAPIPSPMTVAAILNSPRVEPVRLYAPGIGTPVENGTEYISGPHFPKPHKFYAQVTVKDGIVIAVK